MRYRVKPTAEQEQRAKEWLEQPIPEDEEAFAQLVRDLDAIVAGEATAEELEAAE